MKGKNSCLALGILLLGLSFPIVSNAAESQGYQTEGGVTFFGEYTEVDSNEPINSVGPNEPEKNPRQDSLSSKVENNHPLKKIPQTGDTSNMGIAMLGVVFTAAAFYLVRKNKKIQWSESI